MTQVDVANKAKIDLMATKNSTFLATILWSLRFSWDTNVPTAGTNGIELRVNPEWFMGLTPAQRIGLLAHEAWHVALEHMCRGVNYDFDVFNVAADYVINVMLVDAGYEIPEHGYMDIKYRNMSTEQVYKLIYEDVKQNPNKYDYPKDIEMVNGDGDEENGQSQKDVQSQIESIIIRAQMQSEISDDDVEQFTSVSDIVGYVKLAVAERKEKVELMADSETAEASENQAKQSVDNDSADTSESADAV